MGWINVKWKLSVAVVVMQFHWRSAVLLWKLSYATNFWVFSSNGRIQCLWGLVTQLCSPSNACVERGHTLCAYIKLSVFTKLGTFCLHSLWCGSVIKQNTFYLHQTPSWLWLVWTNSPVFSAMWLAGRNFSRESNEALGIGGCRGRACNFK